MTETIMRPVTPIGGGSVPLSRRTPVTVAVVAADPMVRIGLAAQLRRAAEFDVLDEPDSTAVVTVLVTDTIDDAARLRVRRCDAAGSAVVLIADHVDPLAVVPLLGSGVRAVLARREATVHRIRLAVRSLVSGGVDLPSPVLRRLIDRARPVGREYPGLHLCGLSARERNVLALVAEGFSTREIATKMAYSERTIKNVLQDLTTRLQLRNRTHAVAYALQRGWI